MMTGRMGIEYCECMQVRDEKDEKSVYDALGSIHGRSRKVLALMQGPDAGRALIRQDSVPGRGESFPEAPAFPSLHPFK